MTHFRSHAINTMHHVVWCNGIVHITAQVTVRYTKQLPAATICNIIAQVTVRHTKQLPALHCKEGRLLLYTNVTMNLCIRSALQFTTMNSCNTTIISSSPFCIVSIILLSPSSPWFHLLSAPLSGVLDLL